MTLSVLAQGAFTGAETVGHLALGIGGLVVVLVVGTLVAAFGNGPADDLDEDPVEEPAPL